MSFNDKEKIKGAQNWTGTLVRSPLLRQAAHGGGCLEPCDIAIRMDGFTVFIGGQIDREIDRLGANYTGYSWERVTTHNASFGRS
jgi:hypothetical protein